MIWRCCDCGCIDKRTPSFPRLRASSLLSELSSEDSSPDDDSSLEESPPPLSSADLSAEELSEEELSSSESEELPFLPCLVSLWIASSSAFSFVTVT
jgi:hypothetical protein